MAELFDPEQYRQQMSGQYGQPAQTYPQASQSQIPPNPYQARYMPQDQTQAIPYQAHEWTPQHQQHGQSQYVAQPQDMGQPMPAVPVFAPPPGANVVAGNDTAQDIAKPSRFKRKAKGKKPKVKKTKSDGAEAAHTTKTSPAIIFMFGMATGIVCFLVGNMVMSNILTDNSAKSFAEIERQNAKVQQPVLPNSTKNTEG